MPGKHGGVRIFWKKTQEFKSQEARITKSVIEVRRIPNYAERLCQSEIASYLNDACFIL